MKNSIKLLALSAVVLFMSACDKSLLDPKNSVFILEKEAYSTPARVQSQVIALYDAAKSGAFLGSRMHPFSDIRGEEFLNRTQNAVTGLTTWNQSFFNGTNEVGYFWATGYAVINQCNTLIGKVQSKEVGDVLKSAPLQLQYEAEARFIRALSYSYLVRMYCRPFAESNGTSRGLPLRLGSEADLNNNDLAPSNVAAVYTQILADLNFAETNLPLTGSVTRAHRNTVIALKTRIYLAMQRWADVITEANKIVPLVPPFRAATGVAHALNADPLLVFAPPYTTTESIFSFPFSDVDQPGTQNSMSLYWAAAPIGNGEYTINTTRNVGIAGDTANFPVTDARRKMLTRIGTAVYLNGKFPTGPINTDFTPIMRYPEVLLNLAEALTRNSSTVDVRAVALLNAVRGRADASVVFTVAGLTDATALRNAILTERRIEFLGEGFRSFDITRNLLPFPAKSGAPTVAATAVNYVYPIPSIELTLNKLMVP